MQTSTISFCSFFSCIKSKPTQHSSHTRPHAKSSLTPANFGLIELNRCNQSKCGRFNWTLTFVFLCITVELPRRQHKFAVVRFVLGFSPATLPGICTQKFRFSYTTRITSCRSTNDYLYASSKSTKNMLTAETCKLAAFPWYLLGGLDRCWNRTVE